MKKIDFTHLEKGSKTNIEGVVLTTLGLVGLATIAVFAPNALKLLKHLDKGRVRKKEPKYVIDEALKRLIKKKLIVQTKSGQLQLTKAGIHELYMIEQGAFPRPRTPWDGKWRIVSFDVAEKRKKSRDQLRFLLRQVGFVRLQDSVWVYPYDVKEVITLIQTGNFLQKEVLYITAQTTGKDKELKSHFSLA
jgi:hypothetical protein